MKNTSKIIISSLSIVLSSLFFVNCASSPTTDEPSQIRYGYNQLKLLDLDQMTSILTKKANEAKSRGGYEPLYHGLFICFGRPNEDGMIEKVLPIVKNPLEEANEYSNALSQLTEHAIFAMQNPNIRATDQVTYGIILENLIAELKPEFIKQYDNRKFESELIEKIAASKVQYSDKARSERKLNIMKTTPSPSIIAQNLLDKREAYLKQKEKDKKKK